MFCLKCFRFKHVYHLRALAQFWVWPLASADFCSYCDYVMAIHIHMCQPPPNTGLLWGPDNCVMVGSLSGSGQATGLFSQSRHLLCCAALFNSDVMSCDKSHPYKCGVQERAGVGV